MNREQSSILWKEANNVLVGGHYLPNGASLSWGQAYLFDATTGNLIHTLNDPTPTSGDDFGHFLAIEAAAGRLGEGR